MVDLARVDLRREFKTAEARANPLPVYARMRKLGPVLRSKDLLGEGLVPAPPRGGGLGDQGSPLRQRPQEPPRWQCDRPVVDAGPA